MTTSETTSNTEPNDTLDLFPPALATALDNLPLPPSGKPAQKGPGDDMMSTMTPFAPSSSALLSASDVRTEGVAGDAAIISAKDTSAAGAIKVVHAAVNLLKPHHMNAAIYGDEPVDDDLVASISNLGVVAPLHATVEHVIVDGHRRLKAARAAGLSTVPLIVLDPGHDALAIEELLLEANRCRNKNNEQRAREFAVYLRIESERARVRMNQGKDPVLKLTQGGAEKAVGKARDIAAKKVGWSWATARKGLETVEVLDRLLADGDPDAAELRKLLHDKKVEAAHTAAVSHGWIEGKPATQRSKQVIETHPETRTPDENKQHVSGTSALAISAPQSLDSSQSSTVAVTATVTDADDLNAESAAQDPADRPKAGQVDGQQSEKGQTDSPYVSTPVVPSNDLPTELAGTPPQTGTIFRLVDGSEAMIASIGEDDLITDKKLRAILQVSVSLGDKDAVGVEALTRRQMFEVSTTETMNRLSKAFPHIPAQRLWAERCMADRIFQKQMKLN